MRIQDADGNVETIQTTDEHPFYLAGVGWVAAKDLRAGDRLGEADGSDDSRVLSSTREDRPEGVAVYNFEVEGDHTYFVEDGLGAATAVWVHNRCATRGRSGECLKQNRDTLLTFYDFPGKHSRHIRTSNPIENTFATARLRHDKTKGNKSKKACLAMVYKLGHDITKRTK